MNADTIVNQVENIYNGLGQLAFQYQAAASPRSGEFRELSSRADWAPAQ